ncbi:MAG: UDP-3-O-(3-hydroxymyristoyl)glucosamine N-acyltransferase [Candidatus Omnitrophota bacterium]
MTKSVQEIAFLLKGEVVGNGATKIAKINSLESAKEGDLAFAFSKKHLRSIEDTKASCVVVPKDFDAPSKKILIKTERPKEAFIGMLNFLYKPTEKKPGTNKQATVSPTAKIGKGVYIGPHAVVEDEAAIGDNTTIEAGVFIGQKSSVGKNTFINPNVTIYHHCCIGSNCIIHSNTVIGSDGFGFFEKDGIQHKIPQIGKVVIHDNVEIGSNVSIDRATVGETVIEEGAKLDNLIQVAHNVRIGKNVVMAGGSGIAGSAVIEDNVVVAAQAGIKDHVRIGKGAIIGPKAGVKDDVAPGKIVIGIPAKDGREVAKELAAVSRLTKNINKIFRLLKAQEE